MLKIYTTDSCPKNATTGDYPDTCAAGDKVSLGNRLDHDQVAIVIFAVENLGKLLLGASSKRAAETRA